ncbi:hypothetical protein SAMN05428947_10844 [Mucilaginibacter sp. OK283]|nr:hypothetical protein SAMN05428947_10844 [Mucilaginibacter sp. OK283]
MPIGIVQRSVLVFVLVVTVVCQWLIFLSELELNELVEFFEF